jgi:hypothetical protein
LAFTGDSIGIYTRAETAGEASSEPFDQEGKEGEQMPRKQLNGDVTGEGSDRKVD